MEIMKYPNVSGGPNMAGNTTHIDEVDSLFTSSCWQNSSSGVVGGGGGGGGTNSASPENSNLHSADYMDTHKLILDSSMSSLGSDKLLLGSPIDDSDSSKNTIDDLGYLLVNNTSINTSLAELKPLPPFTGYTANLSINGIQGHHYHAIAQRIPEENNNYSNYSEQNIVSSSTCNVVSADSSEVSNGKTSTTLYSVDDVCKIEYDCVDSSAKLYENSDGAVTQVKTEIAEYDISSIEDIAAIIGSAIADTTVPNPNNDDDNNASRDSWMDLDAWIDGACGDQQKSLVITQEGLSEFIIPNTTTTNNSAGQDFNKMEYKPPPQPPQPQGSTLQSLLTHGYMPLLQNRLQNGPPIKQEMPSSSNYNNSDLISTSSPPSNVVSTTDNLMLTVNGRFLTQYNLVDDRIRSPDILGPNYPHTTTASTPIVPKKSRSRAQKKAAQQAAAQQQQQQQAASSTVFQAEQSLGLLGKEKPVHRCSICNRGFLNKSNIKVHLRTHTGEKPFRCDTCAKAFRQKAHLLKHQQIHKRIGRD